MAEEEKSTKPGTTAILFPETVDGGPARDEHGRPIEDDPNDPGYVPPAEEAQAPAKPAEKPKENAPEQKAPEQPPKGTPTDYLDNLGVKVKTNVFGKTGEITVEELVRSHQKYQAADELLSTAKEVKRKLDEDRTQLLRERAEWDSTKEVYAPGGDNYDEYGEGTNKVAREVQTLREQLQSMAPLVGRMRYQGDIDVIDTKMKQMGHNDFKEYVPKIEAHILSLPEDQQRNYHSMMFYENFFLQSKLSEKENELLNKGKTLPDQREAPNIPRVETGDTASVPADDTSISRRKKFDQAKESGNLNDWGNYINDLKIF